MPAKNNVVYSTYCLNALTLLLVLCWLGFSFYFRLFSTVPDAPPTNLTVNIRTAFSLNFEWAPVPRDYMNGLPLGYIVNVLQQTTNVYSTTVDFFTSNIGLQNLTPSTRYTLEVCAFNRVGTGPCNRIQAVTKDSGKSG